MKAIEISSPEMHEMYESMVNGYFEFSNRFTEWKEGLKERM